MSARTLLLLALLSGGGGPLAAWGSLGHQLAAETALRDLPPGPAPWFLGEASTLPAHANDPDQWKRWDVLEGGRHYLDCEAYGGPAGVPFREEEARARLGPEGFLKNGQLPWAIQEAVRRLSAAFQGGDRRRVALEAAWLCHYVADAQVPLHATTNYNGAETGQQGVHGRWEGELVRRLVEGQGLRPESRPVSPEEVPESAPWAWIAEDDALAREVLEADREAAQGAGEPLDEAYWQAFTRRQGPQVMERLSLAGQRCAGMIRVAWERAGRPLPPPPGPQGPGAP